MQLKGLYVILIKDIYLVHYKCWATTLYL